MITSRINFTKGGKKDFNVLGLNTFNSWQKSLDTVREQKFGDGGTLISPYVLDNSLTESGYFNMEDG